MGWKEILKYEEPMDTLKETDPEYYPQNTHNPQKRKDVSRECDPDYFDSKIQAALDSLNKAGKRMIGFPEEIRAKAFQLEKQMTEAANAGDRDEFLSLLLQWRGCFH